MVFKKSFGNVFHSHCIASMAISCIISEIKQDIGRKLQFLSECCYDSHIGPIVAIPSVVCQRVQLLGNIYTLERRQFVLKFWKEILVRMQVKWNLHFSTNIALFRKRLYGYSYKERQIGIRTRSFECCHFQ